MEFMQSKFLSLVIRFKPSLVSLIFRTIPTTNQQNHDEILKEKNCYEPNSNSTTRKIHHTLFPLGMALVLVVLVACSLFLTIPFVFVLSGFFHASFFLRKRQSFKIFKLSRFILIIEYIRIRGAVGGWAGGTCFP